MEALKINHLHIGGITYRVIYLEEIRNDDDRRLYGDIKYENAEIRVALHDQQVQLNTLIHEAIHGILNHAGITEHDEKTIEIVANGLMQVLAANPQLRGCFDA